MATLNTMRASVPPTIMSAFFADAADASVPLRLTIRYSVAASIPQKTRSTIRLLANAAPKEDPRVMRRYPKKGPYDLSINPKE